MSNNKTKVQVIVAKINYEDKWQVLRHNHEEATICTIPCLVAPSYIHIDRIKGPTIRHYPEGELQYLPKDKIKYMKTFTLELDNEE